MTTGREGRMSKRTLSRSTIWWMSWSLSREFFDGCCDANEFCVMRLRVGNELCSFATQECSMLNESVVRWKSMGLSLCQRSLRVQNCRGGSLIGATCQFPSTFYLGIRIMSVASFHVCCRLLFFPLRSTAPSLVATLATF